MTIETTDTIKAQAMLDRELIASRPSKPKHGPQPPKPLGKDAYYGFLGDAVKRIDPHTESSSEATFFSLMISLGVVVGRKRFALASGAMHAGNDFAMHVGPTGSGRKGSSWGHVRFLLAQVMDEQWMKTNIKSGLSSGEGLITPVQDSILKADGTELEEEAFSKNLLIREPEMALPMQNMARVGNNASAMLRSAWDDGNMSTLTKVPRTASNANLGILGDITPEEIALYLNSVTSANGFANRFLYCWSDRDKLLPHGGGRPDWGDLPDRLTRIIDKAQEHRILQRTPEASQLWEASYPQLSSTTPGFIGAMNGRAEAHALRLQVLYSILDETEYIDTPHVLASLAVVQYSEDTVRYVFSGSTGNKDADRILTKLSDIGPMSKSDIHIQCFGNNLLGERLDKALLLLEQGNYITHEEVVTNGNTTHVYDSV